MRRLVGVSLLLLLGATACDQAEPYLPTVSFDRVEVDDLDFERADVRFVFDVENPDPVDISVASFDYGLKLGGVDLLSGSDDDGMTLEAVGSSELDLPVTLAWDDAWATVEATRGKDDIGFDLSGDFGFDTPVGEALLPYDEAGRLPAPRAPKVTFQRLRVARVDAWSQTADVALDLGVDNEHASAITLGDVDYDLSLGGAPVGAGHLDALGSVDGATVGTVTMPMTIDLADAGQAVWDALQGQGTLAIGLRADLDVGTPWGTLPLSVDEDGDVVVSGASTGG